MLQRKDREMSKGKQFRVAIRRRGGALSLSIPTYTMAEALARVESGRRHGIRFIITDTVGNPV